jgi:phage/plasmid-like protein (TIGR03299 family)
MQKRHTNYSAGFCAQLSPQEQNDRVNPRQTRVAFLRAAGDNLPQADMSPRREVRGFRVATIGHGNCRAVNRLRFANDGPTEELAMPAEVTSMMYVGAEPWHGLGVKVDGAINSQEAIERAGLQWRVDLERMFTCDGLPIDSHRAVRRDTDGKVLGIVGKRWRPLQNENAFAWFDPFVAAGEARYETAGALRDGARVWILAKLNREDSVIVPQSDDRVSKYVLLSNGHDGSLAVRVGFTPVRVVCSNTLAAAHGDEASKLIRLRHTGDVAGALEGVREVMDLADAEFEASAEQYRALARHEINRTDLQTYIKKVFDLDDPGTKADGTPKASRVLDAVTEAFETGAGNDLAGVRGTWWAAYNAVTDYLTHTRGTDAATRLDSQWYGASAATNQQALQYAYVMATG